MSSLSSAQSSDKPFRAAIYVRVSTRDQEQEGTSLATQEERCRAYAAEHGYQVDESHVYREVFTGAELWDRPELTRLREIVRARDVDVIVSYAIDRLSRDPVHLGVILSEAEYAGVRVEFVTEPLDDSPEGQLIRFVRGYAAKIERMKIAERSIRGKRAKLAAGKMLPSRCPLYGYTWKDEQTPRGPRHVGYEPNPQTAPVVRRIFELASAGEPIRAIAARLDAEGIPTPLPSAKGLGWAPETIRRILRHPAYCGEHAALRWRQERDGKTGRKVLRMTGESERIPLPEETAPPLVDRATWQDVNQRLLRNRELSRRNNRNPTAALLRGGYVRCGYCGHSLVAENAGGGRYRYVCTGDNYNRLDGRGKCYHAIETRILDDAVWEKVARVLRDPDRIAQELRRQMAERPNHCQVNIEELDRRDRALARQQANLIDNMALVTGDTARMMAEKLALIEHERRSLAEERARLQAELDTLIEAERRADSLVEWIRTVQKRVDSLDYNARRLALEAFGVEVILYRADHDPRWEIKMDVTPPEDGSIVTPSCRASRRPRPRASSTSSSEVAPGSSGRPRYR